MNEVSAPRLWTEMVRDVRTLQHSGMSVSTVDDENTSSWGLTKADEAFDQAEETVLNVVDC